MLRISKHSEIAKTKSVSTAQSLTMCCGNSRRIGKISKWQLEKQVPKDGHRWELSFEFIDFSN